MHKGLVSAFDGTGIDVLIDYHAVVMGVPGYPHGMVRRYESLLANEKAFPAEERSKVIWLNNRALVESKSVYTDEMKSDELGVFCLSIRHKTYGCRAGQNTGGEGYVNPTWTHPEDVELEDFEDFQFEDFQFDD